METSSKGIWIPEDLLQNEDLTIMEKLFLIKINGLDGAEGCYASNKYFAEYFKLSRSRCSVIIKSLKDKGYVLIKYHYEKGKELIERRVIKIKKTLFKIVKEIKEKVSKAKESLIVISKKKKVEYLELSRSNRYRNIVRELGDIDEYEGYENYSEYGEDREYKWDVESGENEESEMEELNDEQEIYGVEEDRDLEEEIKYFETMEEEPWEKQTELEVLGEPIKDKKAEEVRIHNKFKVNKMEKNKNDKKSLYQEIVGYLNIKCNKNYKYTTGKTQRCINARIREGYSLEDFKRVIDKKHFEWAKTSMKVYLRPETLFGSKFERYLIEERVERKNNFSGSIWRGGQAYGKQFENVRNSEEDNEDIVRIRFGNIKPLTAEEIEWAERELF